MPDDDRSLPVEGSSTAALVPLSGMPVALQIFFDQALFERCKTIAKYLSDAKGIVPAHVEGHPATCFAIVSRALTWKQDPFAVAQATYEVGGKIGYYGSLCQSIMESSGRLIGGIKFEHFGDWDRVQRKFKIVERTNQYGKSVRAPEPAWTDDDEEGVGVHVTAQFKDEAEPRVLDFYLKQAYPRNSTLWATDPMTQIKYTAVRRFATSVAPTLFMGVPFDREEVDDWAAHLKDVTPAPPRPRREPEPEPDRIAVQDDRSADPSNEDGKPGGDIPIYFFTDEAGEVIEDENAGEMAEKYEAYLDRSAAQGEGPLDAAWENGARLIHDLRESGHGPIADALAERYSDHLSEIRNSGGTLTEAQGAPPASERPGPNRDTAQPASARQAPAALSANPNPHGNPPNPEKSPFFVPYDGSAQAWFSPARTMVMQMLRDKNPKADFTRFREVNTPALLACKGGFRSWWKTLDDQLRKGEGG